jgi:ATP-dependent helicase HrpB
MGIMNDLPIFSVLDRLLTDLKKSSQVILSAEPGAGKSTQVPLALLRSEIFSGQKIIMLEPRRIAAKRLAEFLADQLEESVGQRVGYRVKNDSKVSAQTQIEVVTEGVLVRFIQDDPELNGVGLVIFDEFHERNLQADLGLTLLLDVQQGLREDLKCLIMSATLDHQGLQNLLPNAELICCKGRSYPVTVQYWPAPKPTYPNGFIAQSNSTHNALPQLAVVLEQALSQHDGDVLIFLPGQREIHREMESLRSICQKFDALALALYSRLKPEKQAQVFQKTLQRKVIFSTNIAESSLTIPGIKVVIDSGVEKKMRFDPNVAMSRLVYQSISKASASQRMGRAGRLSAGHCYRLWSESQQMGLREFDEPDIQREDLTSLRMEVALWGTEVADLHWPSPPPKSSIQVAESVLRRLGYLTDKGRLTVEAESALTLYSDPRMAKILQQAQAISTLALGCDVVALLQEEQSGSHASWDMNETLIKLQNALTDASIRKALNPIAWQQWKKSRQRLRQKLSVNEDGVDQRAQVGELLALSFPDRLAKHVSNGVFKMSNGRQVSLANADRHIPNWLVAITVDAKTKQGKIFQAFAFDFDDVSSALQYDRKIEVVFDESKQRIQVNERYWLDKLLIKSKPLALSDYSQEVEQCLFETLQRHPEKIPLNQVAKNLIQRAGWLSQFKGFSEFKVLSFKVLYQDLSWLQPYLTQVSSIKELENLDWQQILLSSLDYEQKQRLEREAPEFYLAPTGKKFVIEYTDSQAKVSLPLQQLFGEARSPCLAGQEVALIFELLSPAQRPIQVTSDLSAFWQGSYLEVAKDMKGRYPKHRWPDNPMAEQPGSSINRRSG